LNEGIVRFSKLIPLKEGIVRFSKLIPLKEGIVSERRPKDRVTWGITL
jgi:hypothetical protein